MACRLNKICTICIPRIGISCNRSVKKYSGQMIYGFKTFGNNCEKAVCLSSISRPVYITFRESSSSTQFAGLIADLQRRDDDPDFTKNLPKAVAAKYKTGINHDSVMASLNSCSSVTEQIEYMDSQLHISREEQMKRLNLCKDLEKILNPYFPNCHVTLVGSSISGFGLKGCDVDLSFESHWDPSSRVPGLTGENLPTVDDIDSGSVPITKLGEFSPKLQLRFVRRVLKKHWPNAGRMYLMAGRCPVLQFPYGNSTCDLTFGNRGALMSTKLLYFCGHLDKRVIPLTKVINYWAKQAHLIGPHDKFKSYAFALLIIHFLQTRKQPVLPLIQELFNKTIFFENGISWDFDISKDLSKFSVSKNKQTVEELLREFFFFYLFFDFTHTICPLNGVSLKKSAFYSSSTLEAPKFELGSTICIQDPFEETWNVTTGVSYRICKVFMKEILAVCKFYQDPSLWKPSDYPWGLAALMNFKFTNKILEESVVQITLTKPVIVEPSSDISHSDPLFIKIPETVLKVLSYAFLFECKVLFMSNSEEDISHSHFLQNVDFSTLNDTNYEINKIGRSSCKKNTATTKQSSLDEKLYLKVHCVAPNVWQGRYQQSVLLPNKDSKTILEFEHSISHKVLESDCDKDKQFLDLVCECVGSKEDGKTCLKVLFKPVKAKRFPSKVGVFLKEYIPYIVENLAE